MDSKNNQALIDSFCNKCYRLFNDLKEVNKYSSELSDASSNIRISAEITAPILMVLDNKYKNATKNYNTTTYYLQNGINMSNRDAVTDFYIGICIYKECFNQSVVNRRILNIINEKESSANKNQQAIELINILSRRRKFDQKITQRINSSKDIEEIYCDNPISYNDCERKYLRYKAEVILELNRNDI